MAVYRLLAVDAVVRHYECSLEAADRTFRFYDDGEGISPNRYHQAMAFAQMWDKVHGPAPAIKVHGPATSLKTLSGKTLDVYVKNQFTAALQGVMP